ncbi:hypothetical protein C4F40_11580 [Sphingobacterium sp. Ka21]|uniref:HTH cro/C1-type domain-containing protein n=2 Tax=Sphingobacterium pedocola TaxID=2082722 RepID=A0ABR9T7N6_9SPHI|nr:hypothetical protein [Sphingobacterium pedocola]
MVLHKIDEVVFIITLLESLRNHFKIERQEIDEHAKLKAGQYSRMIGKSQKIDLKSLRDVCKNIYNLSLKDLLNLDGEFPAYKSLPNKIQELTKDRNSIREQKTLKLTSYLVLIIDQYYKLDDVIKNKFIRTYLPTQLNGKSIELSKTSIKNHFKDINEDKASKTKIYKLISHFSPETIENAKKTVDPLWLKEFEEHIKTE